MPRKPTARQITNAAAEGVKLPGIRYRGHDLLLYLERSTQFGGGGETAARASQKFLDTQYKLDHNIPLNVWDAARSYRLKEGTPDRGLRSILQDDNFRGAWNTFRGGHKWVYDYDTHEYVKHHKKEGGITSTFEEKMQAAKILGWGEDEKSIVDKLRNISP